MLSEQLLQENEYFVTRTTFTQVTDKPSEKNMVEQKYTLDFEVRQLALGHSKIVCIHNTYRSSL